MPIGFLSVDMLGFSGCLIGYQIGVNFNLACRVVGFISSFVDHNAVGDSVEEGGRDAKGV